MASKPQSTAVSVALLQAEVQRLSSDVEALTKMVETLVEHDVALRTVIRVGTWIGAVIAGIAGVWAAWRAP